MKQIKCLPSSCLQRHSLKVRELHTLVELCLSEHSVPPHTTYRVGGLLASVVWILRVILKVKHADLTGFLKLVEGDKK
jgi:hypothetical protein